MLKMTFPTLYFINFSLSCPLFHYQNNYNKLTKTVQDSLFQSYKEKSLEELNNILNELLEEKEKSKDISEYSLKIKELYS